MHILCINLLKYGKTTNLKECLIDNTSVCGYFYKPENLQTDAKILNGTVNSQISKLENDLS